MLKYCPGAKSFVEPQIIIGKCPYCGEEVEFFEYETEQECPNCGQTVRRKASETCVVWCNYADKCINDLEKKGLIDDERARELKKLLRESKNKI